MVDHLFYRRYILNCHLKRIYTRKYTPPDILFGSLRAYFRKVVRPRFNGVCSTDITVIRANSDTNQIYLHYFIANPVFISNATNISSGTRMPRANWNVLAETEWAFPTLPIQRKIASILSAYDDLIENNNRRIKILEEMAKTIYDEWFVKFHFPGYEKAKMVESEPGMIPVGWEIGKLKDIINNVRKNVKAGSELNNLPYVPIDLIPRKSLALSESLPGHEAKSSLIIFKGWDILFGAMRSYFHKVVIAPFDGITRSTCFVLRPVQNEIYSFVVLTLFEDKTVDYSHRHSRGSTMPYAVWDGSFAEMPIIKPPKDLLIRFKEIVKPILEKIKIFYFQYNNLRQTRDFLLPKLISGEIDVENLDINTEES